MLLLKSLCLYSIRLGIIIRNSMRIVNRVVGRISTESRWGKFGKVVGMEGKYGMMIGRIQMDKLWDTVHFGIGSLMITINTGLENTLYNC